MTIEEALAIVQSRANSRTVYPGQPERVDEVLAAEVERLTEERGRLLRLCAHAEQLLAPMQAEVERLRAIVDELPKTADGVTAVPGTTVYYLDPDGDDDWFPRMAEVRVELTVQDLIYASPEISECYSTRESAEAKGGGA